MVLLQSWEIQSSQLTSKWDFGQERSCRRNRHIVIGTAPASMLLPPHSLGWEFLLHTLLRSGWEFSLHVLLTVWILNSLSRREFPLRKFRELRTMAESPSRSSSPSQSIPPPRDPGVMVWAVDDAPLHPQDPGETRGCQRELFHPKPLYAHLGRPSSSFGWTLCDSWGIFLQSQETGNTQSKGRAGDSQDCVLSFHQHNKSPCQVQFSECPHQSSQESQAEVFFQKKELNQPCGYYLLFTPCSRVNQC